jgi:hypothetical protein
MILKNAVFWDVTPCGSCKNRRIGETYRLHHQPVTANIPISLIIFTMMMEMIRFFET